LFLIIINFDNMAQLSDQDSQQNNNENQFEKDHIAKFNNQKVDSFEDMKLKAPLLKGIYNYGFTKPSAIQQRAILPILQGRDVIAQSQSGTGKTTIFAIATLQIIDTSSKNLQALILSPTRELAEQTRNVMLAFGEYMKARVHACIGGTKLSNDIKVLSSGLHIISGTPGRINDLINRRAIDTKYIKILIIDEADEMLARNFKTQLYDCYRCLPPDIQ